MSRLQGLRRWLGVRLLGAKDAPSRSVLIACAEGCGVVYGCRIDPNPLGQGFRIRSNDPRMLHVVSNAFMHIPGTIARDGGDGSGELLLFVDSDEYDAAVKGEG